MTNPCPADMYQTSEYAIRNPTYHEEDAGWKTGQILKMIYGAGLQPQTICDVGCGVGAILSKLQQHLPPEVRFTGYEITPAAHRRSLANANANLNFCLADLTKIDTPVYDLLLCIDVLEHIEDVEIFLRALQTKARLKLFHIPLEDSLYKNYVPGRRRKSFEAWGHLHFFNQTTALSLLRENGYDVVDWFYTRSGLACSRGWDARLGRFPVWLLACMSDALAAKVFGAHALMVLAR